MKKTMKRMMAVLMALLMISAFVLPVAAVEREEEHMAVGDTMSLGMSQTPYESSDSDVVEIEHDGGFQYTARAVGKGTAVITGGTWMGAKQTEYEITVHGSEMGSTLSSGGGVIIIIAVLLTGLLIAASVYIFIEAPKQGLSRWWAMAPLLGNGIGLLLFLIIRSERKKSGYGTNT